MKRIYWLQDLLSIAIWGSILIFAVVCLVALVTHDSPHMEFNNKSLSESTNLEKVLAGFISIGYVLFFWGLFKMKKLVFCFTKREFFSLKTTKLSKEIGYLFILAAILIAAPIYFYQFFSDGNLKIYAVGPGSFFFLIIIGIFFRTIGFLFEEAKDFKEDSELSI